MTTYILQSVLFFSFGAVYMLSFIHKYIFMCRYNSVSVYDKYIFSITIRHAHVSRYNTQIIYNYVDNNPIPKFNC